MPLYNVLSRDIMSAVAVGASNVWAGVGVPHSLFMHILAVREFWICSMKSTQQRFAATIGFRELDFLGRP